MTAARCDGLVADWTGVPTFPPTQLSIAPVTAVALASIGDPDGTRTVTSIVVLLIAIGLALILLAVWIHRTTRPDPELLAPLEVMGERSWRRGDPVWQRRRLDEVRPAGAKPLAPSVAPPDLDASFDAGPSARGFDDLRSDTARRSADVAAADHPVDPPDGDEARVGEPDEVQSAGDDVEADEAAGDEVETQRDATPPAAVGPTPDVFLDDDFDPEALAAAREQLERELAESGRLRPDQRRLDVVDRDQGY